MIIRYILGADGEPSISLYCFAYVYSGESESEIARERIQAHALRPGESSGYLSRLFVPNDEGTHAVYLLVALALNEGTRELFESADWGEGADVSDKLPEQIWNDALEAHVQRSLEGGADRLHKSHYPDGSGRVVEYGEESSSSNE
jgi:hypothetical protein